MSKYKCPVCSQEMKRDLAVFLEHANKHIVDAIKKKHPEWIEKDGICPKCVEYYRAQMRGADE